MIGKITGIQIQNKNKKRVNIYIDGEYALSCDMEIIYKHRIKTGDEVDVDFVNKIVENDNFSKAKNDGLRLVERSYKTEKELREKLIGKGYSDATVGETVEFLKEYNFLDDEKYTRMFVNDKIKSRGKNKIKYDLMRKGVNDEIVNEIISNVNADDEFDSAFEAARKKFNNLAQRETDQRKIKQKLFSFLTARGYSWETCKSVAAKLLSDDFIEE